LFPEQGRDVPVVLTITGASDGSGRPVQRWSRLFRFPTARRFDTFVSFDPKIHRVIDRIGPGRLLAMESVLRWRPSGQLLILSTGWSLRRAGVRLPLPSWLFGRVVGTQSVDPESDRTMNLSTVVSHPLLGEVFGYEGYVTLPDGGPS
jgi:hypothetical protein